jgi:hypothetical protein
MVTNASQSAPLDHPDGDTVVVPVITLEEVPRLDRAEREALLADLARAEAEMAAGKFVTYSRDWLRARFEDIYYGAPRRE